MIDDCHKPLIPNLKSFCCLRHLIEMNKVCEERMISHKYYKYILRFFHKYSQISINNNVTANNSLPLTLSLLSIMSKCISYFFSVSKISFSKFMAKIALKVISSSLYKEHPEVLLRSSAIRINLASIYLTENKCDKAINEMNIIKPLMVTNIDKLIFYNNYIKIYYTEHNDEASRRGLTEIYDDMKKILFDLIYEIKNEKIKNPTCDKDNDVNLIVYICYNYALQMEMIGNIQEAKNMFKVGYEFGICMLNEKDYMIDKYQEKVSMYNLNKLETINNNINSEDDDLMVFNEDEDDDIDLNVNINNKLGIVMKQLETITAKINSGELTEKEHQDFIEQAEQIKIIIAELNRKDSMSTPKGNKRQSNSSTKGNTSGQSTSITMNRKAAQIVCKEKEKPVMKNIENNVDLELKSIKSIDKNINKFYSSDENNSSFIDFHTNISQINLLDIDNQSDDTLNVVNKNMSNVNTTPNVINTNNSPTPNQDRVKKMPIEINIDAIDDDEYECVTYYEKAEIATPKINIHLDNDPTNEYKCETFYLKLVDGLTREIRSSRGIANEFFFSENKIVRESFRSKLFTFDVDLFFDSLTKPSSRNIKPITAVRFIKNEKYLLMLMPSNEGINISLAKPNGKSVSSIKFDYFKLKQLISKLSLYVSLRIYQTFSMVKTLIDFTSMFLVNHVSCRYQDGYKFGISQNAIGVFLKKSINLKIRHVMCIFDILIFEKNKGRLIVYSSSNENSIICIDADFDSDSFDSIFTQDETGNFIVRSDDYSKDDNIITIGKNVQRLLNGMCLNRYNTFDDMCANKKLTFHIDITDNCKRASLACSEFTDKLYKVNQMDTESSIKKEGIIYSCNLREIFGYEVTDFYKRTNQYEKTLINQIVLSSFEMNTSTNKITLMDYKLKEEHKFHMNGKLGCVSLIDINGNQFLKMMMYHPMVQQEHFKLLIIDGKVRGHSRFHFDRYHDKIKQIFEKTINNVKKGIDCYIEEL